MKVRRALIASYDVPQDDRDSGSRRLFDLTLFLRDAGWAVDLIAANGIHEKRGARALQRIGVAVHQDLSPSENAVGPSVFENLIRSADFDLALLAFWPVARMYLPTIRKHAPRTPVIVDSVDLHFLRLARQALHSSTDAAPPVLLDAEFGTSFVDELNTYLAADAVLTVSKKEVELLCDFSAGAVLADFVPDCEDMPPSPLSLTDRNGILLLGSFQHQPNVDALEYFCRRILPRINHSLLAQHPVYVVGTGLDEHVRSIVDGLENIKLVGWVPSVLPYFHRTRISAVPLLYGAGTKRKMIQALMSGTPAVSTSIGTEGLDLNHEEHVLIADDAEQFARGIERLLVNEVTWTRLATKGRDHILQRHGRAAVRDQLTRVIELVLQRAPKPAMLGPCSRERNDGRVGYNSGKKGAYLRPQNMPYAELVTRVRETVERFVPACATVVVVSKGDDALLQLGGRRALHFPQNDNGKYAGFYPADGSVAISQLESLRQQGGDYLMFPSTAFWWLEHYDSFAAHLEERYRRVVDFPDTCAIYSLRAAPNVNACGANSIVVARGNDSSTMALAHHAPGNGANDNGSGLDGWQPAARLIAFYLPQFHPIPENDRWWGEGFTEWRNVLKAKPLFRGHHQPQLPTDLGFYDLRCPETREDQADLAHQHGIHGFCYYHYWFDGKRLLERPFDEVLHSGRPDFPFCLCWANEPWSRRWDGSETDVLQPQSYSSEDDLSHIRWLLKALADPRAITIDGRPVFLVYRADQLPDAARTTDVWRKEVDRAGLNGVYLIAVETGWDAGWDATQVGFDAKLLFQPQFSVLSALERLQVRHPRLKVFDYQDAWPVLAHSDPVVYRRYDTVCPSWDNSPRRGTDGWVLHNSRPEAYEDWLRLAVKTAISRPADQRVVFINAWNEWAEGAHLEPDRKNGRAFLEATLRAAIGSKDAGAANLSSVYGDAISVV